MTHATRIPTGPARTGRRPAWVSHWFNPVSIALLVGTALVAALGAAGVPGMQGWQPALRGGVSLMFLVAASGRLGPQRAGLIAMVPPRLPRPDLIVAATGVLEAAGAIGLWVPPLERIAAACLALLLVAVFPANVRAARAGIRIGDAPATPLVPRTIEQVVYVACCLAVAIG
ncbi:DoxX family protein [Agromyces sp. H66]|uniref:DoxX family protein n=1 Tax=Agromyces sp. H66 TaxID=2529859 RepID=UPI0010AA3455|nr:DoxX family protein [Agromyces sp. H66]